MKRQFLPAALALAVTLIAASAAPVRAQQAMAPDRIPDAYRDVADRIIDAALADSAATWNRLAELVDTFGPRLSGTQSLNDALDWILEQMEADGLDNVHGEPVMVPHWVRGEESVRMVEPRERELGMTGLGGSIGTPEGGITAEVMVVSSFDELEERGDEAQGKIVLFDVPFTSYGRTVQYRSNGAIAAAQHGAVASLIRSVTPFSMNTPHTGAMRYRDGVRKIPHAALILEDAEMIHRMIDRGDRVVLHLEMNAETLPDVESQNVMAEIRGREYPDQVVAIGGHTDSWDVGQGAMDDGGGVVVAWEAVRLLKELGLQPRRTIRAVGWVNEENGLRGGTAYGEAHADETHVLAIESDEGVFDPEGFGFTGSDDAFAIIQSIGTLLDGVEAGEITRGGGGADISPLMRQGVPGMGLNVDGTRYFWYHHTEADTLDKLNPSDVAECVAAMAVMAYVVADLPQELPR